MRKINQTAVPNISVAIGSTRELNPSEVLYTDSIDYLLDGANILLEMRRGMDLGWDAVLCQGKARISL